MAQFLITYLGGNPPASHEEAQKQFNTYMTWLKSLGDKAVSPANPLKGTNVVNPDGTVTIGSITTMSGYSIIEAEDLQSALSIAKGCPFLEVNGSLEVSEIGQMPSEL